MKNEISQIFNIEQLQSLLDKFTISTGTGTAIIDLEGNTITASGWQDICTKFFRIHPKTSKNCLESDTSIANGLKEGCKFNQYKCLNGLVDVAVPIIVKDEHIANLFIGQFLLNRPDLSFFREKAKTFGFDEQKFMDALGKVPVFTEEEVKDKIEFLSELAIMIGEMGIQRIEVEDLTKNLEEKVNLRTLELKNAQLAALNMMQDAQIARKDTEEANEKLEVMMSKLKESNEQLERFAYVASHDLQEPLRKISSFSELFVAKYQDIVDDKGKKYIEYIVSGTHRMQTLINDLLSFSRINTQGKDFERIDTKDILNKIIDMYSTKLEASKGTIKIHNLPVIYADDTQIFALFQNLIGNALKFTRNGVPPEIEIYAEKKDKFWFFHITDNGIGIDMQYQDRIFIIFQRLHTKEAYEGTGIGLSLCQQIVKRHGGEISFKSELGKGTTFTFSLPVLREK